MSQTATEVQTQLSKLQLEGYDEGRTLLKGPIKATGAFKAKFGHIYRDITPAIGREYGAELQLDDLLHNASDEVLRDFAVEVSTRGVVLLKNQNISAKDMQAFILRFHRLAGAPINSGLHIHPSVVNLSENGENIQKISSAAQKAAGGEFWRGDTQQYLASRGWHSDISWEPVPADYSMLKLIELPSVGGDTMFASGEELYKRLSPSFAAYLETLSALHKGNAFLEESQRNGSPLHPGPRGSPLNKNLTLEAIHPIVRTNPVTGAKAIFVNPNFTTRVVGVTPHESETILKFLFELMIHNFDLQLRVRWDQNDLALWDNRSTFHSASFDFDEPRSGDRACSLGERPFFDPSYGKP